MSQAVCSTTPAVFQFNTQPVRIVMQADEPWFIAADIAKVLEYRSGADVSRMCDDDERGYADCAYPLKNQHGSGGTYNQKVTTISQPGLFRALANSRSNRAKPFQRWLFHDVLPQIMKTGGYAKVGAGETAAQTALTPDEYRELLEKRGKVIVDRNDWQQWQAATEFGTDPYKPYRDAAEWVVKLGGKHGRGAALAVLAQFGANHLYRVPVDHIPELVAACKKVLGTTANPAPIPALTPQQAEEITQRIDNLTRLFHPHSQPFADVMGIARALRGLDPKLGARAPAFVPLLPDAVPAVETPLRQQVVQTLRAEYSHGDYKALARDLGIHESSAKKIVGRLKLGASA